MGLDMYMEYETHTEDRYDENGTCAAKDVPVYEEVAYWRKHPNLHGFFERKWREAGCPGGSEDSTFNGMPFYMSEELIDETMFHVRMNTLPETTGFFFGESVWDKESIDYDIEQLTKVKDLLAEGKRVFYNSSW